jgi:lipopolysaccharide biosynthesis glycosyltransferase
MKLNNSSRNPRRKQKSSLSFRCLIVTAVVLLGTIFIFSMYIYMKNYAADEAATIAMILGIESEPMISESTIEEPITSLMDTLESEYNVLENRDIDVDTLPIESLPIESLPIESLPIETSRFAYSFLVAGCKPEDPTYKGYLYNIAIARELLTKYNSTSDVVVMIRMHVDTNATKLLPEEEAILTSVGAIIKYIPRPLSDTFHTAMMDKFRILELTEYERVIYLDADVMPLNNLDYMFENSVGPNAKLQENVVLTYHAEPSNGGFFMLKPDKEDFLEITKIIERRESEGYEFNETIGWGHVITPPDYWESLKLDINQTSWTFYGAFTDQGLLYYWTKYVKKNVTIINGKKVTTWKENENGNVQLIREESTEEMFQNVTSVGEVTPNHRFAYLSNFVRPYKDFHHFVQNLKPWLDKTIAHNPNAHIDKPRNQNDLWFNTLRKIEADHHLGINTTNVWNGKPTLGSFPAKSMVMWAKESREKDNDKRAKKEVLNR